MTAQERANCAVLAAWLDALAPVSAWSLLMSVASVLALWLAATPAGTGMPSAGLLCALLLGLAERYLRVRIVFDRHLFAALAAGVLPQPGALDVGLHRLGLRKAAAQPRLLDERINGTLRLARAQVLVVLIQMLVLFCWIVA